MRAERFGRATELRSQFALFQLACLGEGLGREDAEDCAMEMLERVERGEARAPAGISAGERRGWLWRCAVNFARDFRRKEDVRSRREISWPVSFDEKGRDVAWDPPEIAAGFATGVLLEELRCRITVALARLSPNDRILLSAYYVDEKSVADIADALDRRPDAVKKALLRARRRWRASLERSGLTREEACSYLTKN